MIRNYYFFANWRKKDVAFMNSIGLNKIHEAGVGSFSVEEGPIYDKLLERFSRKNGFFSKAVAKEFYTIQANTLFSREDLDNSHNYDLIYTGESKGDPKPMDSFEEETFSFRCPECFTGRSQTKPIKLNYPKWRKGELHFTLRHHDIIFVNKIFFKSVLEPLGVNALEVKISGKKDVSNDIIQLDLPEANSSLDIEGSPYDIEDPCDLCGKRQYSMQIPDFFPPFIHDFEFSICKTKEEFGMGMRKVIISKSFCQLLTSHGWITYDTNNLTPMKWW